MLLFHAIMSVDSSFSHDYAIVSHCYVMIGLCFETTHSCESYEVMTFARDSDYESQVSHTRLT